MTQTHSSVAGLVLTVLTICASPVTAREPAATDPALAEAVDAALRPGLTGEARVAVRVLDADTGEVLLETDDAGDAFIPASNMKLVTTATTLDRYGPDYELTTTLQVIDENLWVIGGGDPALGDPNLAERAGLTPMTLFDDWAAALLKVHDVDEIHGDIVVCDPVFDDQLVHPTWHPGNLLQWYGAPVAGVSFNDNCIDVTFLPTQLGEPAKLDVVPPAGGFEIVNTAVTVGEGEEHDPQLAKRAGEMVYEAGGTVGRQGGPYSKPVDDPRRFLGETLVEALQDRGIPVVGDVQVTNETPPAANEPLVAVHVTPLLDVLGRVNTNSQNMMAEALAKLNGLAYDKAQGVEDARGSWASGHLAAVEFLNDAGIDTTVLVAADGSGLSRENRVSAELISDLLLYMLTEHEHSEHFIGSMAISGVRGSVRNRMDDMKGRVYAKTGTISGVSALSGYVFHDSGRVLVFSIIHNGIDGSAGPYRNQQDDAVRALWEWLDTQPEPVDGSGHTEAMQEAIEVVELVSP